MTESLEAVVSQKHCSIENQEVFALQADEPISLEASRAIINLELKGSFLSFCSSKRLTHQSLHEEEAVSRTHQEPVSASELSR